MKLHLSRSKDIPFFIALILAVLALLMTMIPFRFLFGPVWWALIAFAILALGNLLKGI